MNDIDFRQHLLPIKDKIYRMGLRITRNAQEAEDLTQDTLVKVWRECQNGSSIDNLEAYCITVCRNLALDRIERHENGTLSIEAEQADALDTAPSPEERLEQDDRMRTVQRIFNELPERQRSAIQLRDIEGMTYAEAAAAMGISEELFKVTLHRARKIVREAYEKQDNYYGL